MQDIDESIVRKAQGGDMSAFKEIYSITSSYVYTLALRTVNNVEDAQEVTQDVFVKIHRHLKKFKFDSSFKTWIYRIAVNTALNVITKRSKDRAKRAQYQDGIMAEPTVNAKDATVDREDATYKVNLLLNQLNQDQKTCLTLREIDGLSYQEIAKVLDVNMNTVRTRIKRARESLLRFTEEKEVSHAM